MAKKPKKKVQNAAQIRGDIQRGLTGDKRPGFDPATSPLETDSEAGGAPLSADEIATARATQRQPGRQQQSRNFDNAMQWNAPGLYKRRPSLPALLPLIAVVIIGLAVLIGLALR